MFSSPRDFPRLYIFRPAYIYPVEPRKEPNFSYRLMRRIYPVFRALFPNQVIRADDLARAMVDVVVLPGWEQLQAGCSRIVTSALWSIRFIDLRPNGMPQRKGAK